MISDVSNAYGPLPMLVSVSRLFLLSIAFCIAASAQVAEVTVAWKRSNFDGVNLGQAGLIPRSFVLEDGSGANLYMSINGRSWFGHELTYGYERDALKLGDSDQGNVQVHKFYYDFVAHALKRDSRVRPFVLAGVGFSSYVPPSEAAIQARTLTKFGVNFGGGLKVRLHDHVGVRFDVRDLVTQEPNFFEQTSVQGKLHNVEFAAGLSLLF